MAASISPETLMNAVIELEEAYNHYKDDPEFNRELTELLNEYAGRPSRLYYAAHMTEDLGGAKVYLKRRLKPHRRPQDQQRLRSGASCKKMGKTRVIAETGAGQHRGSHSHSSSSYGNGMRGIHGKKKTPSARL